MSNGELRVSGNAVDFAILLLLIRNHDGGYGILLTDLRAVLTFRRQGDGGTGIL